MTYLPAEAAERVRRIEALLAEADALGAGGGPLDESGFTLRETRERYLPDTLRAYLDVPPSLRAEKDSSGKSPEERLSAQLELIERAVAQRLREAGARRADAVAANERFLAERFGPAESLPEAASAGAGSAPPALLVRAFFASIQREAGREPARLVALAAERFGTLVPQLLNVRRGMLGMGAVEAFSLDIPLASGALRYSLAGRRGSVEASVTKVVRGVALRTEVVEIDLWLQGLYDDLGGYVERDRQTRDTLTRFLET